MGETPNSNQVDESLLLHDRSDQVDKTSESADAKENNVIVTELSTEAMNFYKDPCEVVWTSWIPEKEGIIPHEVNNSVVQSKTVPLLAGTRQVYWGSPDGEALLF